MTAHFICPVNKHKCWISCVLFFFFSSSPWGWRLVYEATLSNSSCFVCSWGWVQAEVLETFTTTGTWTQPWDLKLFPFDRLFQTQSLSSSDARWQIWIFILRLSFLRMCIYLIHVAYLICASMNKPLKHSVLKCLLKLLYEGNDTAQQMVAEQGTDSWLLTQKLTGRSGWGVLHQHHSSLVPPFRFCPFWFSPISSLSFLGEATSSL